MQTVSDAEIQARVDAAVAKLTSEIEARQELKTKAVMADLKDMQQQFNNATRVLDIIYRHDNVKDVQTAAWGGPHEQELK